MADKEVAKEIFEGDNVCEGCSKLNTELRPVCTVYGMVGMAFREKAGYCPVVGRRASWRDDKPKVAKAVERIGQQKQK